MSKCVVIAGGGTGGHLFPGIALAKAMKKHDQNMKIIFAGTQRGIESRILPKEGFPLITIHSAGLLGKKGWQRIISWLQLPLGLVQSLTFLVKMRPALVVGVGGYVSGPVVFSAWILGIPTLVHEQNSFPGATNRLLGKIVDKVAVSFRESARFFPRQKVVETGNMIREEFFCLEDKRESRPDDKFHLLVLGGSQGAHSINKAMTEALPCLAKIKDQLFITHQTGDNDLGWVRDKYKEWKMESDVRPFFEDMASQYQKANLIVSRAGATTLAEITACGKAAILVPFPHAAHNHQEHNARALVTENAAEMILDRELTGDRLAQSILKIVKHPEQLKAMEANSFRLGKRDATKKVLQLCFELMEQN